MDNLLDQVRTTLKAAGKDAAEIETSVKEIAEKCGLEYAVPVYVEPYVAFGGATSFADIDGYMQSENLDAHVSNITWQFQSIVDNVLKREDLTMAQKSSAISQAASDMQDRVDNPPPVVKERKGLLQRLFPSKATRQEAPAVKQTPEGGSFTVYKDAQGRDRWLAVYSNNFYDRDGEVFTEDAHKEYIDWVDRSGRYPELWLWHTPGSKVGKADVMDYQDGLAIASGTFDSTASDIALRLMQSKGLGVSHGYRYEKEHLSGAGDYRQYRTFEISPLPLSKAANEGTLFLSEGEIDMELTKEKRAFLVTQMGEDRVARIESNLGTLSKELKESGVAWKDFSESVAETPPAAAAAEGSSPPFDQKPNANAGGDTPAATDAPAASAEDQAKAFQALVTGAVKAALDERLQPIESRLKELDGANNTPRFQPTAQRPSESNAPLNANNAMAKEASEMAKEGNGEDDPMDFYRRGLVFAATVGQQQQPVAASGAGS